MGTIKASVKDVAETREFVFSLPDNVQISLLAAKIAELMHLPVTGRDKTPLNFSLLTNSGRLLSSRQTLLEAGMLSDISLYIAPEVCAGVEEVGLPLDYKEESEQNKTDEIEKIIIQSQKCLIDENGLDLPSEVRINASVYKELQNVVCGDCHIEYAGILLGEVKIIDDVRILEIKAIAPASGAMGSLTSVRFTPQAWEAVLKKRTKNHPELSVLGWFHSHAGWGVFMSDADLFIHENFFTSPNHLCFVTDATIGRDAFFMWQNGEITICSSYGLVGTTSEVGQPVKKCKKRKSIFDFKTIVIMILSVMLIYSWFFRTPSANMAVNEQISEANSVTADILEPTNENTSIKMEIEYTISAGDTLGGIARKHYNNALLADKLGKYNNIKSSKSLRVGQTIKISDKSVLQDL